MKAFLSLLFSALIAAVQRWWNARRESAARAEAERLRDALASVGDARALEEDLQRRAQGYPPASTPTAGQRRVDLATGRIQVWTGTEWRELSGHEPFFP